MYSKHLEFTIKSWLYIDIYLESTGHFSELNSETVSSQIKQAVNQKLDTFFFGQRSYPD